MNDMSEGHEMRFLIVKMSAFGDIVHAYPVARFLKDAVPGCSIDWVVEKRMASLVSSHPLVDRTIAIDTKGRSDLLNALKALRKTRYDVLIDLQGNCKSGLISLLARANKRVGFGFKTAPEWPNALISNVRVNPPPGNNIRQDYLYIVEHFLGKKADLQEQVTLTAAGGLKLPENFWLICPGSNWPNKKLTQETLRRFLELVNGRFKPHFVFLCGSAQEKYEAERLAAHFGASILERPSLPDLQHAMSRAQCVISMDSLPLHLAGTTETPTFSIFGPSSSHKYAPLGAQHASVQGSCPYNQSFEKRCKRLRTCPTGACMHDLDPEFLFNRFCNFINNKETILCNQ